MISGDEDTARCCGYPRIAAESHVVDLVGHEGRGLGFGRDALGNDWSGFLALGGSSALRSRSRRSGIRNQKASVHPFMAGVVVFHQAALVQRSPPTVWRGINVVHIGALKSWAE